MKIEQLETPALFVDLDVLERNHQAMMQFLSPLGVALRPHYKSHKTTWFAHYQVEHGAKGITCAKLSEAEDLALSGIGDILIANQVVEKSKIARLATLAGWCRLAVCVDDEQNIRDLNAAAAWQGSTIRVLVEYEVGMNRCGAAENSRVVALAKLVQECPHLELMGIQAYAGQLSHEENYETRRRQAEKTEEALKTLKAEWLAAGLPLQEISGASTGTVEFRRKGTEYTEVQAGSYLFMDEAYERLHVSFEHSLFMLATVISAKKGLFVTDAGVKSLGVDQGPPSAADYPGAPVNMSEEHCTVTAEHHQKIGDKLRLIPGHCCTTINLNNTVYLVRGGEVVDRLFVTSRGKSL
ncbi:DSD1 family PLP-dependent enzyme [Acidaminobacterium chupaoyuni]